MAGGKPITAFKNKGANKVIKNYRPIANQCLTFKVSQANT
jgi:hypothetical protein